MPRTSLEPGIWAKSERILERWSQRETIRMVTSFTFLHYHFFQPGAFQKCLLSSKSWNLWKVSILSFKSNVLIWQRALSDSLQFRPDLFLTRIDKDMTQLSVFAWRSFMLKFQSSGPETQETTPNSSWVSCIVLVQAFTSQSSLVYNSFMLLFEPINFILNINLTSPDICF